MVASAPKLPFCNLAPKQIYLTVFTSFATNVPQNRMSQVGYKSKKKFARSTCSIVLCILKMVALLVMATVAIAQLNTLISNYCP